MPILHERLRFGNGHLLISKVECIGLSFERLRAYSMHLTAASWKLWYRLASTVGTLLYDVSTNMACNWILNALCPVSTVIALFFCLSARPKSASAPRDRSHLLERLALESLARHLRQIHSQGIGNVCICQPTHGILPTTRLLVCPLRSLLLLTSRVCMSMRTPQ